MRHIFGLVVAGAVLVGQASTADAQVSFSVGNPYTGQGVTIGGGGVAYSPGYSYGYGYSPYAYSSGYYSPGYGYGYSYPTTYYSSGYSGYYPGYSYSTYSYPSYGYGGWDGYYGRGRGWNQGWGGYGYGRGRGWNQGWNGRSINRIIRSFR